MPTFNKFARYGLYGLIFAIVALAFGVLYYYILNPQLGSSRFGFPNGSNVVETTESAFSGLTGSVPSDSGEYTLASMNAVVVEVQTIDKKIVVEANNVIYTIVLSDETDIVLSTLKPDIPEVERDKDSVVLTDAGLEILEEVNVDDLVFVQGRLWFKDNTLFADKFALIK